MPHVSVIIPAYNAAPLIGGALESVFAQDFRDFEVIVVDDGSIDGDALVAALSPWKDRVQYVRQENGGPAKARNTGIARAKGALIAFLDADDEWLPGKLRKQVEYFARYPETGLLHTGVVGDPPGWATLSGAPHLAFCELYHTDFFIRTLTVMIPRAVLDQVGPFDERREVHIEDWDLWLRIAARHPIGFIPEPLAYHRPGGIMSTQVERTYAAQQLVMEKNKDLCARACALHRVDPARCDRARRHVLHRDWGYDRLRAGDRRGARAQFTRALACDPSDTRTALLYLSSFVTDRWARPDRDAGELAAPAGAPPKPLPSLVHDTAYRRVRRRVISRLHDLDDRLARTGRTSRRILFDAASPMSFTVFRPVYERLRRDARLELWFTVSGDVWQPQDIFGTAGITTNVVDSATAARMKVDAYVNADFWDMTWVQRRTRRIHLFHGVAGKYGLDAPLDLAPTVASFDCLMFVNEDRRRRYIEAGLVPADELKAPLVGYPKVDRLVDGSLDRQRISRELSLDPSLPVVIYAPTWSPYSSLNQSGEEIVDRLTAEGFQVIVKLHDRSYDRRQRGSGGIDWSTRLAKYESHPRVRIAREADGSPFLAAADALVSDHSSIAFEYMVLDRPIVIVDCPELIAQAAINPEKVQRLRSAADVVASATELPAAVRRALAWPERLSPARRRTAEDLFYRPGTATDRAVALIYQLLNLPAFADAAEPVGRERALLEAG
jgi:glycosyltransferase involved in cell wall biosynthesis